MRRRFWVAGLITAAVSATVIAQGSSSSAHPSIPQRVADGSLHATYLKVAGGTKRMPFYSGGRLATLVGGDRAAASARLAAPTSPGIAVESVGCSERNGGRDVRVNQDCTYRRQAETDIAVNPNDPNNLVAGMNDSITGFNRTSMDFSVDGGRHWGAISTAPFGYRLNAPDQLLPTKADPNRHTLRGGSGTSHSYDACSDPYLAVDSRGRFFYSCVGFDIASNAGLVFVVPSPVGAKGSYFDQVPPPFDLAAPYTGREHIVAEDNNPAAGYDAPKVAADAYVHSRNRDNVYFTWTVFNFTCGTTHDQYCESPIWGSMSTDHGFTWSTPQRISGVNRSICTLGNAFDPARDPGACNLDGHSDIQVRPNGDLAVTFISQNTAGQNPQILSLACRPTGDSVKGTASLNCAKPNKVANYVVGPSCDFGRGPEQCIPGVNIRAPFETAQRLAVDERTGDLYNTWYDYRRGEFDVFVSRSVDGRTWSAPKLVNPDRGTDHYFSAIDIGETARPKVAISYYRTDRVAGENNPPPGGFDSSVANKMSDYVLSGGRGLNTPYHFTVLSPRFPPPDGLQAGFNGDYSGINVDTLGRAHPVWSDTRSRVPNPAFNKGTVDEDVFTVTRSIPGT
jgi:hypothetical protein